MAPFSVFMVCLMKKEGLVIPSILRATITVYQFNICIFSVVFFLQESEAFSIKRTLKRCQDIGTHKEVIISFKVGVVSPRPRGKGGGQRGIWKRKVRLVRDVSKNHSED